MSSGETSRPLPPGSDDELALEITRTFLRVVNRIQRFSNHTFGDQGPLTMVEGEMSLLIWENPGVSAVELSEALAVSRSATSQVLTRLKGKGYVREEVDPANRRRKLLHLTTDGEVAVDTARHYLEFMNAELFGGVGRDELAAYWRFVSALDGFHAQMAGLIAEGRLSGNDEGPDGA